MLDKDRLLEKYISKLAESPSSKQYISYAKQFLDYADDLEKSTITSYLERLRRAKKSPGTIRFHFKVIRRIFSVNERMLEEMDIEWPFRQGEAPIVSQKDEMKTALDPEYIKLMVDAVRNSHHQGARCFMAISTIYGLRRQEMCNLAPSDLDFKVNIIFVRTLKHGRARYHLIPEEIQPHLQGYDFSEHYSVLKMSELFWVVVNMAGLHDLKGERVGWHSIRTTVKTLLDDTDLNPIKIHNFMRWKGVQGDYQMDVQYHASHFLGAGGRRPIIGEAESDQEIFERHPLLSYWR